MPDPITITRSKHEVVTARGTINVGIVGFGKMGQIRFDAVMRTGCGRVVAVADPDRAKFKRLSRVRMYTEGHDLIQDPSVEAVFICTPNYQNRPLTIQALLRETPGIYRKRS